MLVGEQVCEKAPGGEVRAVLEPVHQLPGGAGIRRADHHGVHGEPIPAGGAKRRDIRGGGDPAPGTERFAGRRQVAAAGRAQCPVSIRVETFPAPGAVRRKEQIAGVGGEPRGASCEVASQPNPACHGPPLLAARHGGSPLIQMKLLQAVPERLVAHPQQAELSLIDGHGLTVTIAPDAEQLLVSRLSYWAAESSAQAST